MRFATVCSGIEAASQAWMPLGWKPKFFSEIEPFPCAYLAHHYPNVPNLGDMTKWKDWPDATLDVLAGGTPCQDYSVAGKRAGMAGERGGLTLTFLEIVDRYRPRWVVWENVPGVLSSNGGRDFAAFLGDLGQRGYGFAYRVLDAQFTRTRRFPRAVPQRRRRVWVVGYLGDWRPAAAVLFDAQSLQGNPPPRRETGQGIAVSPSLRAQSQSSHRLDSEAFVPVANSGDIGYCLTASAQQSLDAETETLVAHALRAEGFDASEDGTGRQNLVPVAFSAKDHGGDAIENLSPTLRAGGHSGSHANAGVMPAIAIQERAVSENPNAGPQGKGFQEDHAYTLEARNKVQAVAFDLRGREGGAMPEGPHDTANLRAADGGSSRSYVAQPWAVRRLTPIECEQLMGFPDNSTRIPYRGKPAEQCPDGPRYKALGNSWAVNCAEWIGERIEMVEGMMQAAAVQWGGWAEEQVRAGG